MDLCNFQTQYDDIYQNNLQKSIWPWSDLITKVMLIKGQLPEKANVLELGCGMGANIPFFQKLGFNYYSIEGSQHAVELNQKSFPLYRENIKQGTFLENSPFLDTKFDLIVDRASLTCNSTAYIKKVLQHFSQQSPQALFVGIDWYSTQHDEFKKGTPVDDDHYYRSFKKEKSFFDPPVMSFSDKSRFFNLFDKNKILHLEEKIVRHEILTIGLPKKISSWNIISKL